MKRSKFTEGQFSVALRQTDHGVSGGEISHKLGICEQTYYRWRRKDGNLVPS